MDIYRRKLVSQFFDMGELLTEMGTPLEGSSSLYCPFHDDAEGGHKSARYYDDDNSIYCWSCCKKFGPYDALHYLGFSDLDINQELIKLGAFSVCVQIKLPKVHSVFGENRGRANAFKLDFIKGEIGSDVYVSSLYSLVEVKK